MIAKGLDFPNVTLVGVINADNSLNIPDFRSSETTFALLNQVSGRSGRGEKEVVLLFKLLIPNIMLFSMLVKTIIQAFLNLK